MRARFSRLLRWNVSSSALGTVNKAAVLKARLSMGLLSTLLACLWLVRAEYCAADEPTPAGSLSDLEQRVRNLEVILSVPSGNSGSTSADPLLPPITLPGAGPSSSAAATTQTVNTAGWKNGFLVRSEDDQFLLRITGQIQADFRGFLRDDDEADIDGFLVRRARLGIEATMLKYYEFRLLPDFGQGQSKVQDAYLNVHYCDEIQFEMGRFKQPVSYEQLIQDRFVPTLERSVIDQIVPARDVGVMVHGQKLFDNRFDYAASISNGEINGDFDTNDSKDLAWRVAARPFGNDGNDSILHGLQIGVSGSLGELHEAISPNILRTPATVPWFRFNSTVQANGTRTRLTPEISYFRGPFGFAAQYLHQEQEMNPTATGGGSSIDVNVPFDGFYVLATYLLTGEERTSYSQAIEPLCPFDPLRPGCAPGAWEIVARVSQLEIGSEVFDTGQARLADPSRFSSGVTELTIGFNWYLNQWVRAQFNWEHARFNDEVRLGSSAGGLLRGQDTLLFRFQIIF